MWMSGDLHRTEILWQKTESGPESRQCMAAHPETKYLQYRSNDN